MCIILHVERYFARTSSVWFLLILLFLSHKNYSFLPRFYSEKRYHIPCACVVSVCVCVSALAFTLANVQTVDLLQFDSKPKAKTAANVFQYFSIIMYIQCELLSASVIDFCFSGLLIASRYHAYNLCRYHDHQRIVIISQRRLPSLSSNCV